MKNALIINIGTFGTNVPILKSLKAFIDGGLFQILQMFHVFLHAWKQLKKRKIVKREIKKINAPTREKIIEQMALLEQTLINTGFEPVLK